MSTLAAIQGLSVAAGTSEDVKPASISLHEPETRFTARGKNRGFCSLPGLHFTNILSQLSCPRWSRLTAG